MNSLGRRVVAGVAAGIIAFPMAIAVASDAEALTYKRYQNCTQLNKVHRHGVGKPGARDRSSGKRVTNFLVNAKLYNLNRHLDRDKDGVACEKR